MLVAIGILATIAGVAAGLVWGGLGGVQGAWDRARDAQEAARLIERLADDTRSAAQVQSVGAATVRIQSRPGELVRFQALPAGGGVEVWREVQSGGGPWRYDPMRPLASFPARPGRPAPTVTFSSPGSGGAGVRVETDVLVVEEAVYSRFE